MLCVNIEADRFESQEFFGFLSFFRDFFRNLRIFFREFGIFSEIFLNFSGIFLGIFPQTIKDYFDLFASEGRKDTTNVLASRARGGN